MKSSALILSLLFITLSIQPAFIKWDNVACLQEKTQTERITNAPCCKKSIEKKCPLNNKKAPPCKQNEDPCNTCNPFMNCNNCGYMWEETQVFSPLVPGSAENTISPHYVDLSTYEDECWHPPELFLLL